MDEYKTERDERGVKKTTVTETTRLDSAAGERTTRQGTAIDTETMTPRMAEERARIHASDRTVHPDWETQPQINAPQDVGIPTAEGQADAARIRAGRRRSDVAEEPRLDRRGGDIEVPAASRANVEKVKREVRDEDLDPRT
jgi:hypothetical protein